MLACIQVNPTSLTHFLFVFTPSLRNPSTHAVLFNHPVIPGCRLMRVYGLNHTAPHPPERRLSALGLHAPCSISHGSERNVINVQPLIKEGVYTLGGEE